MVTSLMSIIVNLEIGNGFGDDLPMYSKLVCRIKMIPVLLLSTMFKTSSLVIIMTFYRMYSIIPISIMFLAQIIIVQKVRNPKALKTMAWKATIIQLPYMTMALVSGQIFTPSSFNTNTRKKYLFLVDAISTFVISSLTLCSILIVGQFSPFLVNNIGICTLDVITNNIELICGCIIMLGLLNCIIFYIFREY
jgi:hypothetical protein